jgi:hypothetical protein
LQLRAQLDRRRDKTAWLVLHKLRRARVDPDRMALADLVEVDKSELTYRTKEDPPAGGRSLPRAEAGAAKVQTHAVREIALSARFGGRGRGPVAREPQARGLDPRGWEA